MIRNIISGSAIFGTRNYTILRIFGYSVTAGVGITFIRTMLSALSLLPAHPPITPTTPLHSIDTAADAYRNHTFNISP